MDYEKKKKLSDAMYDTVFKGHADKSKQMSEEDLNARDNQVRKLLKDNNKSALDVVVSLASSLLILYAWMQNEMMKAGIEPSIENVVPLMDGISKEGHVMGVYSALEISKDIVFFK